MLSRTGIYTCRALVVLASLPEGQYLGAAEIAQQIGAPKNYLGKLLKVLTDQGLLQSQKGKGGGVRLARSPAHITLWEAMEPFEKVSRWEGCFLGHPLCSDATGCPVHPRWKKVRDAYLEFLQQTTIAELLAGARIMPQSGSRPGLQESFPEKASLPQKEAVPQKLRPLGRDSLHQKEDLSGWD
jgi:Rrf2 family protein